MPGLGFKSQHVPNVLNGSKPFTMRKIRKGGGCPRVGQDLFLFENWRTPEVRRFAMAKCVMRTTLWFDARGLAKVQHDDLARDAPPIFAAVGAALMDTGDINPAVQEKALHQLAAWDGFASWSELWDFHKVGGLDANGHAMRRLIGMGSVVPSPGYDVQPVLPVV